MLHAPRAHLPLLALAAAAITLTALPAEAKVSLTKGRNLCVAAAEAREPAAESVNVRNKETTTSKTHIFYQLAVRFSDERSERLQCAVDRESGEVAITPAT
ncbi:MAG: hypothetical protein R3C52_09785 [Hyphomonadaceae bacterium]